MLTFAREDVADVWDEVQGLIVAHHREVGVPSWTLSPSREKYVGLCEAGVGRLHTLRDEGTLIGYSFVIIAPHIHYAEPLIAFQDVLYVSPKYRLGRGGRRSAVLDFINECDKDLLGDHEDPCDGVVRHVRPQCDHSRLLKRMGYKPVEQSFIRRSM